MKHIARRRRSSVAAAAATMSGLVAAAVLLAVAPASAASTLRAGAEAQGRYFGVGAGTGTLSNSSDASLVGSQFDMLTPENEMKWDTTEPSNGSYNFGPGDQIVAFAKAHNMRVRGHNLVWHSQLPSWVTSLPTSQVQAAMESHITTEATHYKGQVYAWDVVNEPFDDSGNLRTDVFYQAMGSGYIADALRTAHAADPNAKLYLNDYNIEGENAKSDAMYNLVKSLISQGVPINGIGLESHFVVGSVPSSLQANMQRFAALGLDVAITELDDRMPTPASQANLNQQATDDADIVKACLAVSRCVGITQWDVSDADSWVPGTFSGYGAATMFDNNLQPKPSYNAVLTALGGTSSPPPSQTPTPTPTPSPSPSISPSPTPSGGSNGCSASMQLTNQWSGGFTANITVTNTGTTTTNSWLTSWTWSNDAKITGQWNTTASQSGSSVGAGNADFNGAISAGQSIQFGVQGTESSAMNPASVSCAANGSSPSPTPSPSPSPTPSPTPSPSPSPSPSSSASSACVATLQVTDDWGTGFTASVTVTNNGSTAINGWKVTWTWPGSEQFTNSWNATVSQNGTSVTALNADYNGTIAAAGSTSFGFQANGSSASPTLTCSAS